VKKILVVEDESTLVATLRYNLEREGYLVATASDGETGLATARSERPDLILLDLMLPGLDGRELCRILRRETTVPILMLTAKAEEVDKVVGLERGADDYVTKPVG
jgi:DNA-binding response OmpR family regulator